MQMPTVRNTEPRYDWVLVSRVEELEGASGIALPNTVSQLYQVQKVGPGQMVYVRTVEDAEKLKVYADQLGAKGAEGWHVSVDLEPGQYVLVQLGPEDPKRGYMDPGVMDLGGGLLLVREEQIVAVVAQET